MISINIKLFASLRESLGGHDFALEIKQGLTITELTRFLGESKGPKWHDILTADNVITAINQTIVERTQVLCDGDELAYFPPVTGG
ncbi:MAG: molybdopterin synthase sulfur carrier subunit [Flavobacterium sp.]